MIATWLAAIALTLLGAAQVAVMFVLRRFAQRHAVHSHAVEDDQRSREQLPKAAIVLALRGADPHLQAGLRRLLTQDYPDHQLVVVVDHHLDPAWERVQEVADEFDARRLQLQELRHRYPNCGLKCSALIQAVESLDDSVEIVVFADADVVAHDHWLESLVQPLTNARIGLVTGAQWFDPPDLAFGSWVRSIWNSGASVPTIMLNHPWAGSCALRRQDLVRSGLVERWKHSIVDDGPMTAAITSLGLELKFVSEAWMVNREHCSLGFAARYLKRMLTWSRLYEPTYLFTVLHAWGCAGLFFGLAGAAIGQAALGRSDLAIVSLSAVVLFWLCCVFGYLGVRQIVRPFAIARGEELRRLNPAEWMLLVLGIPLTYLINAWAAVAALWVRRIQWRGIEYEILSGHEVRLNHYEPYRVKSSSASHSL